MKINAVIREKRLKKGLTQEQLASRLGVSASAVNKWEKAVSYPDITLLPTLARLLETDLNTLLSFQEELSRQEIGEFLNALCVQAEEEGLDRALAAAKEKLQAFPTCDSLLLNTALTLEGLVAMYGEKEQAQVVLETVESLYVRAAESKDSAIADQAKAMLVSKYMERKELDQAGQLLNQLPDRPQFDKKQMQANWYMAQAQWEKAASLMEHRILSEGTGLQSALITLMEIAEKEGREADAAALMTTAENLGRLLELGEYSICIPAFQWSLLKEDADLCLKGLERMVSALTHGWTMEDSPLYRHLANKGTSEFYLSRILAKVAADLADPENPEYEFLRRDPRFSAFLTALQAQTTEER